MHESSWLTNFISAYERKRTLVAVLALFCAIVALGFSAERIRRTHQTPGPFNPQAQGFCDFQNGVYLPSLAFLNRVSPYSQEYAATYPVPRSTPFYSPAAFLIHAPFALMPKEIAEVVYFGWLVSLVLFISYLTVAWMKPNPQSPFPMDLFWLVFVTFIVSRGGQQTFYTGYFTFELILAMLVAIHYGDSKPWISGVALAIVAFKPNFVLPLGLLMLCRGNFQAIMIGGGLSILFAIVGFEWIKPEGGYAELIEQIRQTQEVHRADPIEKPVNNWIRVDYLAVLAKWLRWEPTEIVSIIGMFLLVVPAGILLVRRKMNGTLQHGLMSWESGLIMLTSTVSIYHHVYDAVVLLPWLFWCICVTIPLIQQRKLGRAWIPATLAVLIALPQLNYLSTQKLLTQLGFSDFWFQCFTSVNGLCLLAAWFILICNRRFLSA